MWRNLITIMMMLALAGNAAAFDLWGSAGMNSASSGQSEIVYDFSGSVKNGTFTRNGSSAYTFQSDILASSGANTPAFSDYGLLVEPQTTNMLLQSNDFNTTWVKGSASVVKNDTGPDGVASSATTITDSSGTEARNVYQGATLTAATYTLSVFIKKTTGTPTAYPSMAVFSGSNLAGCTIDTNKGTATVWTSYPAVTVVTSSARIKSANENYWRVELTFQADATLWYSQLLPAARLTATSATGVHDVTLQGSAVYYGAQLELGSTASSYVPTTTGTSVRYAASFSAPLPVSFYKSFEGKVTLDGYASGVDSVLFSSYTDASNYLAVIYNGSTSLIFRKRVSGVNYDATATIAAPVYGSEHRFRALVNADNTTSISWDGLTPAVSSNTIAPVIASSFTVGSINGSNTSMGWFRDVKIAGRSPLAALPITPTKSALNTHSITFSDGVSTNIAVYVPATYVNGNNQKWAVLLHGGGLNYTQYFYAGSPYYLAAEAHNMLLVGVNGNHPSTNHDWVSVPNNTNTHLEEAMAYIKGLYALNTFKPALYGMSMGGYKTVYEMMNNPTVYSAFGASVPPIDMIQWNIEYHANYPGNEQLDGPVLFAYTYPSGDDANDALWLTHSANRTVGSRQLDGRKLWIASGTSDTVVPYSTHYSAMVAATPAANLYSSHLVASGGHIDYAPTYMSEIFGFFNKYARRQ